MTFQNIFQLFWEQTARYNGSPVFYSRSGDTWISENWEALNDRVMNLACALLAKGLRRGAGVAILAGNIPEWTIADIASIAAGGVGVGIYPTSSANQCAYIINDSETQFVFVDTKQQLEKIESIRTSIPLVEGIYCVETGSFTELLDFGKTQRTEFEAKIVETGEALSPEDTAILVYTSGTTGMPKGAMLSHKYILNSVESLRQTIPIFDNDVCLSYLPHCHVAERISGLYNRLYNGTSVYFVDDITKLYSYMLEVKPTVFASLPRFFEKIHAKLVADSNGGEIDAQTVKNAFGGRIRLLTSGGAALPNEVADFFARAGLPILQAYGLTENICVAFNRANDFKFGTVGKPMPMSEVKIAEDGEILINSPMMFSGYYKNPEKTSEMFNKSGWLMTGDLGSIDEDGFLSITGRKKEIIVLSNGKNVAPNLVENYVKENHLISQCFLYGDGKSYCVALITLNQIEAVMFAKSHGIEFEDFAELAANSVIGENVRTSVDAANSRLSSSEQIKTFRILDRDFSAERDEVTPTMKVKRNIVAQNFADEIAALYAK